MFQQEYDKLSWKRWKYKSGDLPSLKKSSPPIPPQHRIYIFRAPHLLNRVRGTSDVIYIGQSGGGKRGGAQGIGPGNGGPGRLLNTRGPDEQVREMIENLYPAEEFVIECYFTTQNEDPEEIEKKLLLAYLKTHYELPPANHKSLKDR